MLRMLTYAEGNSTRIENAVFGDKVAVMDRDGPYVDEDKHAKVD